MSYGLLIKNSAGEICFAALDDAKHMHYLGTATYDSDTSSFTGWASNANQGTRYLVNSPGGPPLVFIEMVTGLGRWAIQGINLVSGTTYEIFIWDSQGSPNTRVRPTLHCLDT